MIKKGVGAVNNNKGGGVSCQAKYQRDGTYRCERCNLTWDYNDVAPVCNPIDRKAIGRACIKKLYKIIDAL